MASAQFDATAEELVGNCSRRNKVYLEFAVTMRERHRADFATKVRNAELVEMERWLTPHTGKNGMMFRRNGTLVNPSYSMFIL